MRCVRLRFQDCTRKKKLLTQLLVPLLSQVGGRDNKDAALSLGPALRDDKASLDCLPEPNLVGQQPPLESGDAKANRAAST
jgi:hypothetical protein